MVVKLSRTSPIINEATPTLLRAMALGSSTKENRHDVILNDAADQLDALRGAIRKIWQAHFVFTSAGMPIGAFQHHIEPAIYKATKLLPENNKRKT